MMVLSTPQSSKPGHGCLNQCQKAQLLRSEDCERALTRQVGAPAKAPGMLLFDLGGLGNRAWLRLRSRGARQSCPVIEGAGAHSAPDVLAMLHAASAQR